MAAPSLRPLGVGEILDVSLKLAWRNFGTLARIVLFVVAPAQLLVAIVDISAFPDYRPHGILLPTTQAQPLQTHQLWTALAGVLVTLVVSFLSGQFATGACFRAIAESYLGLASGWRSSLRFAARKFHSILWITILGVVLEVTGLLFCVVPGVYLAISFAVALPILMSEGQRGRRALGRSRALIKGRWWKTATTLGFAWLLVAIVSGVISGLVSALVLSGATGEVELVGITTVSGIVAAVVTTPFVAAYHTVLYFDLRVRKEAFDLRLLASRVGVTPAEGWRPPPAPPLPPSDQPPFWPPPPGWQPGPRGDLGPGDRGSEPPFWPPPPGWKGDGS